MDSHGEGRNEVDVANLIHDGVRASMIPTNRIPRCQKGVKAAHEERQNPGVWGAGRGYMRAEVEVRQVRRSQTASATR